MEGTLESNIMDQKKAAVYLAYLIFGLFSLLFIPFWTVITIAGIFALALQPLLARGKNSIPHKIVIIATVLTTLLITAPFVVGAYSVSTQLVEYAKDTDGIKDNQFSLLLNRKIKRISKTFGFPPTKQLSNLTKKISDTVGNKLTNWATEIMASLPTMILNLFIFSLVLYLFLDYQTYIKKQIQGLKILSVSNLNELILVLQRSSNQCIISLLIVGATQATIVLIGAIIAGYENPLFIFLITFVFSFIPVLGAASVAFFLSLMNFGDGDTGIGLLLFVIGCIAGTIDNFLTPILVNRGIKMDGFLMLIAIIGSILIFGLPGLLIGPIVSTTAAFYFHKNSIKLKEDIQEPLEGN